MDKITLLTNTNIGLNQFIVKGDYALTAYDFDVPLLVQRRLSAESFFETFDFYVFFGRMLTAFEKINTIKIPLFSF